MSRITAALMVLLPALLVPGKPAQAQDIRAGAALARQYCAECHAVGRAGRSPRPGATAFRLIQQRYPVEALEEAFGEGITGSHKGMPDFQFSPRQIDDLLGYIKRLPRR